MLKIDLKCPVEILSYNIIKAEDNNNVVISMVLHNLSDEIVTDIFLSVDAYDVSEELLGSVESKIHDLAILPDGEYSCRFTLQGTQAIEDIDVVFSKLVFADEKTWERDPESERIDLTIPQTTEVQRNDLRNVTGIDGACFAADLHGYWRCVCGRINADSDKSCVRCGSDKDYVLEHFTTEAVSRRITRERSDRIRRRMRFRKALPVALPIAAVILIAGFFLSKNVIIPGLRYSHAVRLMESSSYDRAQNTFISLGEYKDSKFLVDYCAAYKLLASKKYNEASRAFEKLASNTDYPDMSKESLYIKAEDLLSNGNDLAAARQFGELGGYKDSDERMKSCYYNKATEYLKNEVPFPAVSLLELIPDYKDSQTLLESLPLQMCGYWELTGISENAVYDGEVITVCIDGTLFVPKTFFGVTNTRDRMHLEWTGSVFEARGENDKLWGTITVSEIYSQNRIQITLQSKRHKDELFVYSCKRVDSDYLVKVQAARAAEEAEES